MSTVTPAWMKDFLDNFYNIDTLVSDQASWNLAVTASAIVAVACIGTWATDFRADAPEIDVPMLVLQATTTRASPATAGPTSCRAANQSSTSRRPGGRTRHQRPAFRAAGPATRVAIPTLTMTREKDISLHMKDGHV
jgi:hypothetical protein